MCRSNFLLPVLLATFLASPLFAEDADALREKGIAALKDSQTNPRAIVDAARTFVQAELLYAQAGNDEKSVEMNSLLYWCKKKMTMADIDAFIKGGEAAISAMLTDVEKLAPKPDDAQKWFDRADQFAQKNPNEHLLIAIRFYEVADRFKGSDESLKAQDRSLKEQLQDKSSAGKSTALPTAMHAPENAASSSGTHPIPAVAELKASEKLIQDLFKEEYKKTDAPARLEFVTKLLQQADENKNDAAAEYILLHEARDQAVLGGNATVASDAYKRLRDAFKIDFAATLTDLRKLESSVKSSEAAVALATLFLLGSEDSQAVDNYDQAVRFNSRAEDLLPLIKDAEFKARLKSEIPRVVALRQASAAALAASKVLATKPDDPEANLTAGKFALECGKFESAFAMLAKCKDAVLADISKRELTPSAEAEDQVKLADAWFDRAEKESLPFLKPRMQGRAATWYGNALPALAGLAKLKVEAKLKSLAGTVRLPSSISDTLKSSSARMAGAKVIVEEEMGYSIAELANGVSTHNNENRPIKDLPPELSTLKFTQLVSGNSGPVKIKVVREGRVYLLPFSDLNTLRVDRIAFEKKMAEYGFKKQSAHPFNRVETFEVWSVNCPVGATFLFSFQIMVVAADVVQASDVNTASPPVAPIRGIPNLKIGHVTFGIPGQDRDDTKLWQRRIEGSPFGFLYGGSIGEDPAPGQQKFLTAQVFVDGRRENFVIKEGKIVVWPWLDDGVPYAGRDGQILAAFYGARGFLETTKKIQDVAASRPEHFEVVSITKEDPSPYALKSLVLFYTSDHHLFMKSFPDLAIINFKELFQHKAPSGRWISKDATYTQSSYWENTPTPNPNLLNGVGGGYGDGHDEIASSTKVENDPWMIVDLKAKFELKAIHIVNCRSLLERSAPLVIYRADNEHGPWTEIWQTSEKKEEFEGVLSGRGRYIKLVRTGTNHFHFYSMKIYGE